MADEATEGIRNVHTRISDVSARLQNLRNLLNSERHTAAEQRRAIDALDQEVDHMNHEQQYAALSPLHPSNQDRARPAERRRPYVDSLHNPDDRTTNRVPPPVPSGMNPSNLVRTRRRAFRPSERLTRSQRERLGQQGSLMPSPSYSTPPPRPSPPPQNAEALREYAGDAQTNRESSYRAKRRKLDDGTYDDDSKAITYGWKGQVVPGQLKLDVISCDGGEYQDPRVPVNSFPHNVLQDDASVYCTKSNKCNMLLKHSSGMPFTLTKMVVKAPRSGYDAPIQEGMIFVALDDQDLTEKTARYEINYSPKSYRYHRQRFEATRIPQYPRAARSPLRSIDRSRYLRDPREPPPAWHQYVEDDPVLHSNVIPGFSVTTDDPSDDEPAPPDGPSSPPPWHDADPEYSFRSYADRYRPVYADNERPVGYEYSAPTSDSEDGEANMLDNLLRTAGRAAQEDSPDPGAAIDDVDPPTGFRPYVNRRSTPSRIGVRSYEHGPNSGIHDPVHVGGYERLGSDPDASTSKPQVDPGATTSTATASDTLAPHARFFIPMNKSSVAVKFDPPVAGKYILIKLWASCPNANIDIQSITAYGYGGPRFFPSFEPR